MRMNISTIYSKPLSLTPSPKLQLARTTSTMQITTMQQRDIHIHTQYRHIEKTTASHTSLQITSSTFFALRGPRCRLNRCNRPSLRPCSPPSAPSPSLSCSPSESSSSPPNPTSSSSSSSPPLSSSLFSESDASGGFPEYNAIHTFTVSWPSYTLGYGLWAGSKPKRIMCTHVYIKHEN